MAARKRRGKDHAQLADDAARLAVLAAELATGHATALRHFHAAWGGRAETERRVRRLHDALSEFLSPPEWKAKRARLTVCEAFDYFVNAGEADERAQVAKARAFLRGMFGDAMGATNAEIAEAVRGWKRTRGTRARGAPNKWDATLEVLQGCGIDVDVEDATILRKSWDRRRAPK